jgi:UDP-N-acetylmuramoylalanine-D-glutamate ligase
MLRGVGWRAMAAGNIGVPVTELPRDGLDAAVIEVSSYQAADFCGQCDIAVLTSLFQEHLDWHGSVTVYRRDKLNLLRHARCAMINREALGAVGEVLDLNSLPHTTFAAGPALRVNNRYLARRHNLTNVAAALAVMQGLGVNQPIALHAAEDFPPLPHRQQEIAEIKGVLYVDDSISTTPEATIAALDVYRDRPVTVIVGGHDRGIDYTPLIERLRASPRPGLVLLDASGRRIAGLLGSGSPVETMDDAVAEARRITPTGGVILLSPAAPSYGRYRSFIERGEDFSRCVGNQQPARCGRGSY